MKNGRATQRGLSMVEMLVTLALMTVVMGGIMMFLITHSRMTAGSFDRGDIQRSGRGALTVLEEEIGRAGLGLPKTLAIKAYTANDGATANACPNSPRLEIGSVNFLKQWAVTGTTTTAITLDTITDGPPANPNPGGATNDLQIDSSQWLFIYTTPSQDLFNPGGSFGSNRGHGMVQTTGTRAAGSSSIPVTTAATDYSAAQTALNLAPTSELNNTSERGSFVTLADVSAFGLSCDDPDHPYLYWQRSGNLPTPVASNLSTIAIGGAVGLQFRFFLDNLPAGTPDGIGDTWDTSPGTLTIDPDPAIGEQDNVTAVEVTVILRSNSPDPQLEDYRYETFTLLIQTPNIHTRVELGDTGQLGAFHFVANTGI